MATTVLSPQDCLCDSFTNCGSLLSTLPRTKICRNPTPTTTPNSAKHNRGQSNNRRKRSLNSSPPPRPTVEPSLSPHAAATKVLSMGQVKILKRGEEIQKDKENSPVVGSASTAVELKPDLVVSPTVNPKNAVELV
ncbi:unnamed protein product [Linum trigynum]|uniref:Uncharacterized protein n=1 Tax=Linum trigynum TaxID=586398 RepID=A0AAV2CCN3_9ROSI